MDKNRCEGQKQGGLGREQGRPGQQNPGQDKGRQQFGTGSQDKSRK